jgi:hypothetical protein
VTAKNIAVVFVVYLMMSETEDCITTNNWMTVNCDMGRTLAAVVMTEFRALSWHLFGGTTKKHENSKIGCLVS